MPLSLGVKPAFWCPAGSEHQKNTEHVVRPWYDLFVAGLAAGAMVLNNFTNMTTFSRALLLLGLLAGAFAPLAANADYSKCTKKIKSMGYFITDVDNDWDRPYDKFDAVKNGKEYNIWVDKNTCEIKQVILDNEDRRWND
ncbi:hypothetical protein KBY65_08090 [Cyanobium sp. Alchichica 3B3-8F6]|uniref:hypothetical protein n=1 Tax=Cyanobium sp. Alchichica 3B3-8F6 TaxID=2823696 RepID=UPI0020CBBFD0|nr:hypothetical protein [Cyanobium sp. Alchichica 3B3-8F6]MCP9882440.1 hypothetical protein [Cyanobium sp. Alchichica 3B3-8F6]